MNIFEQEAGVISAEPVWICTHNEYMYIANTLDELIVLLNTEWEHDKHLAM